jgi:hypothetical protein
LSYFPSKIFIYSRSGDFIHFFLIMNVFGQSKSSLMATFFALDQIVWAGRTGIYKVSYLVLVFNLINICTDQTQML